jgi:hypothetical protein
LTNACRCRSRRSSTGSRRKALHNVVKHAGARQVRLEVGRIASGIRLRIVDDGKGFDPARVPDGHLGLAGMRTRADEDRRALHGDQRRGQGTTIEVVVPQAAIRRAARAVARPIRSPSATDDVGPHRRSAGAHGDGPFRRHERRPQHRRMQSRLPEIRAAPRRLVDADEPGSGEPGRAAVYR